MGDIHNLVIIILSMWCFFIQGEEFLCVSLGNTCTIAHQLALHKATNAYYPFDWNLTLSVESVIYALAHKFEHFLDHDRVEAIDNHMKIRDMAYNILLVHDFPLKETLSPEEHRIVPNWRDYLEEVRTKYARRIQRFFALKNYTGKLFFIRYDCSPEQAQLLLQELIACFPQVDLTLIVFNQILYDDESWNFDLVNNYYMSLADNSYPGSTSAFSQVLGRFLPTSATLLPKPTE
jgi:putative papain-like cysteine peptidase DUF1796